MGQLGWVWFGGRSYKITVFYLTEDNSVFCREDDREPILLVSQLPKRVNLGFSGTISLTHSSNQIFDTSASNPLGPVGIGLGSLGKPYRLDQSGSTWIERTIGNSLDDLRQTSTFGSFEGTDMAAEYGGPPYGNLSVPTMFRTTLQTTTSVVSNTGLGTQGGVGLALGLSQTTRSLSERVQTGSNIDVFNGFRIFTRPGDNSTDGSFSSVNVVEGVISRGLPAGSITWEYSIVDIANAFGFMARVLPNKTVFAITDGVNRQSFQAWRDRITTGTLENFQTYQSPTIPTLDADLFLADDGISAIQKQPYSISMDHRSINFYNSTNITRTSLNGSLISNLITTKNTFTSNSTIDIEILDSALPNRVGIKTIPGLPANTKAVLGVLACPL